MYETPLNVDTMTPLSDMNGSKNGSLFHNDGTAPSIGTNFTCQNRNAKVIYVGNSDGSLELQSKGKCVAVNNMKFSSS